MHNIFSISRRKKENTCSKQITKHRFLYSLVKLDKNPTLQIHKLFHHNSQAQTRSFRSWLKPNREKVSPQQISNGVWRTIYVANRNRFETPHKFSFVLSFRFSFTISIEKLLPHPLLTYIILLLNLDGKICPLVDINI